MNERHATLAHRVSATHADHSPAPCATPPRHRRLPNLLWADLLMLNQFSQSYNKKFQGSGFLKHSVVTNLYCIVATGVAGSCRGGLIHFWPDIFEPGTFSIAEIILK